jgi:hypothetical protein
MFNWKQDRRDAEVFTKPSNETSMSNLVTGSGFQLLQFIGLSLPAVALYMTVLTEVFMRPYVKQIPELVNEGSTVTLTAEDMEHHTVTITNAQTTYEFIAAELALGILTIAGLLVIGAIVLTSDVVFMVGIVTAAVGYVVFGVSPLLLAYKTIREASEKTRTDTQ